MCIFLSSAISQSQHPAAARQVRLEVIERLGNAPDLGQKTVVELLTRCLSLPGRCFLPLTVVI